MWGIEVDQNKKIDMAEVCDSSAGPELTSMCYRCVAVLGDLLPVRGQHYWEVAVDDYTEFRVGVAYEDTNRNAYLGATNTSWCMRHILTPTR